MEREKVEFTPKITNLAYKIKYDNNLFRFGFGENLKDKEDIEIKAEFELTKEEFKIYFLSMLSTIIEKKKKNDSNILEEIFEEIE